MDWWYVQGVLHLLPINSWITNPSVKFTDRTYSSNLLLFYFYGWFLLTPQIFYFSFPKSKQSTENDLFVTLVYFALNVNNDFGYTCWFERLGGRLMGSKRNEGRREDSALKHIHSTMSVLTPSPPCSSLNLFLSHFFFSKCKSPWKMCWSNICTEVVLGQADKLSVFEFGFPCSK